MHIYINGKQVKNPIVKFVLALVGTVSMIVFIAFALVFFLPLLGIILAISAYFIISILIVAFSVFLFTRRYQIKQTRGDVSSADKHYRITVIERTSHPKNDEE